MTNFELQFYNDVHKIASSVAFGNVDWETRRYEIAKQVIPEISAATPEEMAEKAVAIADALINRLKNC